MSIKFELWWKNHLLTEPLDLPDWPSCRILLLKMPGVTKLIKIFMPESRYILPHKISNQQKSSNYCLLTHQSVLDHRTFHAPRNSPVFCDHQTVSVRNKPKRRVFCDDTDTSGECLQECGGLQGLRVHAHKNLPNLQSGTLTTSHKALQQIGHARCGPPLLPLQPARACFKIKTVFLGIRLSL